MTSEQHKNKKTIYFGASFVVAMLAATAITPAFASSTTGSVTWLDCFFQVRSGSITAQQQQSGSSYYVLANWSWSTNEYGPAGSCGLISFGHTTIVVKDLTTGRSSTSTWTTASDTQHLALPIGWTLGDTLQIVDTGYYGCSSSCMDSKSFTTGTFS